MMPLVGVPETIGHGMAAYRDVFCRAEGFDHVRRYVTGMLLSPHKMLQLCVTSKETRSMKPEGVSAMSTAPP
jgi:hypothetical protein